MTAPRTRERNLHAKGFLHIAGIDEVGRGALAGPLVAGAVIFKPETRIPGVTDSKLLAAPVREKLFIQIIRHALAWSVGVVAHDEIDMMGIQSANRTAFIRALDALSIQPSHVLSDWLFVSWNDVPSDAIVGGDRKVFSIAAASIVAKVWRDRFMAKQRSAFPVYGFERHKGYGTAYHRQQIAQFGLCAIHRRSFVIE